MKETEIELITDEREAKRYLQELGISTFEDHRTAEAIANLHLLTGSTAIIVEIDDSEPVKRQILDI